MSSISLRYGDPIEAGMCHRKLNEALNRLKEFVDLGKLPGFVILVVRKGIIVLHEAYGYASIIPERRPMRKDTIFDIASMTKPIATATAIMKLIERGEIYLRQRVQEIVPEFSGNKKEKVTIWHLLTHTSGLPAWRPLYKLKSREKIVRAICSMKLEYEPGSKIVYSCLGYIILGEIVERITGKALNEYINEAVFKPLGMKDTMFNPPEDIKTRVAATEYCKWRRRILIGEVHDENAYAMGGVSGNAGLFSTAYDIAIFSQMMLNEGVYNERRILCPLTVKLMTKKHVENHNEARGLGWLLNYGDAYNLCGDLMTTSAFGHTGFTGTSLWIDPVLDLIVILLTNAIHPSRDKRHVLKKIRPIIHNMIASAIIDEVHD